jgi:hypothetical protein
MSNEPVPLTIAPNVPMAEMLCQRLKAEGIPAFYRDLSPVTGALGGSGVNPAFGVEIFVNPEDRERAEQLLD